MPPPRPALLVALLLCGGGAADAQVPLPGAVPPSTNRTAAVGHDVVVSVSEINELSLSSAAVTLAVGGGAAAQDATTTFGVTTNGAGKKITAALSLPYADGVALAVVAAAPAGATSTPRVLGTTAQDLVVGLARVAAPGLTVTYTATAEPGAQPTAAAGGETRTVTFTLTDG